MPVGVYWQWILPGEPGDSLGFWQGGPNPTQGSPGYFSPDGTWDGVYIAHPWSLLRADFSAGLGDGAAAILDPLASPGSAPYYVQIQAKSWDGGGNARDPELIWDVEGWDFGVGGVISVPADGNEHTFILPLAEASETYGTYSPELLEAEVAAGLVRVHGRANLGPLLSSDQWVGVFEFRIYATASASVAPALRQWPRSDGLGLSSARRVWPPPRSIQRSQRPGPGAHL